MIFFSAFVSSFIALAISLGIDDMILDWIYGMPFYKELSESLGSGSVAITFLMKFVVALVIYLPVFIVVSIIISIIVAVTLKISKRSTGKTNNFMSEDAPYYERKSKKVGAFIGVLSAFLITVSVFMPFVGFFKSVDRVVGTIDNLTGETGFSEDEGVREFTYYSNDFMANLVYSCGGKTLFDMTTLLENNGSITCLNKEIDAVESIDSQKIMDLFSNLGVGKNVDIDEAVSLLAEIKKSVILETALLVSVKDAATAWLGGESYMGIDKPVLADHPAVNGFFDEVLYVCSKTSHERLNDDIMTIVNLSELFESKADVFESDNYKTQIDDLVKSGTADLIREELEKNPSMRRVLYAVDDLIMTMIAEELTNTSKFSNEQQSVLYEKIAQSINKTSALSANERALLLSDFIGDDFVDYGVYIPEDMNETIASDLLTGALNESGKSTSFLVRLFFERYLAD